MYVNRCNKSVKCWAPLGPLVCKGLFPVDGKNDFKQTINPPPLVRKTALIYRLLDKYISMKPYQGISLYMAFL